LRVDCVGSQLAWRGLLGSPVVGIPEVAHSAEPPVARVATRLFTTRLRVVNKW